MKLTAKEIKEIRQYAFDALFYKFGSALGKEECLDIVDEAWIKFQKTYNEKKGSPAKNWYKMICIGIQADRYKKKVKLPIDSIPTSKNAEGELIEVEFPDNPSYSLTDYQSLSEVQRFLIRRFSNTNIPSDRKKVPHQISRELFYYGRYLSLLGLDSILKAKENPMAKIDLNLLKSKPEHHKYYLARLLFLNQNS